MSGESARPTSKSAKRGALWLALALALTLAPKAHAQQPIPLRVVSWNVWGLPAVSTNLEARMAALPDVIAKLEPDVVLLQEVWAESDGMTIRHGLERHGYRYASHLAHTAAGMSGLFTAAKLPLKNVGFMPFASGRIGHSVWHLEWIAAKGVGTFLVQTPLGEIQVQNTHLQAQYETDDYAAERLSQVSQILLLGQSRAQSLVLGGDFNTGAEELPRQAFFELGALKDTTPSPLPDTIFVRSGGGIQIRVVGTHQALTEPVRLDNGVTTELSDHPAVVVDLELSACTSCAPAVAGNPRTREAAHAALLSAAAITPWRVSFALSAALGMVAVAIAFSRRTRALQGRSWRLRLLRRTGLAVLAAGIVWTAYLGAFYYPARAKALRLVALELETLPLR